MTKTEILIEALDNYLDMLLDYRKSDISITDEHLKLATELLDKAILDESNSKDN